MSLAAISTEMPESKFGNPAARLAFFSSNPWRHVIRSTRPDRLGDQDLDAACPRVYVLSMEPRSWEWPGLLSFRRVVLGGRGWAKGEMVG
jgi:hypothetical protein